MKDVVLALVVIVGLGMLSMILVTINTKDSEETMPTNLAFSDIQQELKEGALLVDVRTTEEFREGHIKGALHLPLANIEDGDTGVLDPTDKIYVYCRSGARSARAMSLLTEEGFSDLTNLGGYEDIVAQGAVSCTDAGCEEES